VKKVLIYCFLLLSTLNAQEIYATFQVVAKQSANLAFNSSGIVNKIFVDVSSVVKQNEELAILKNQDIKAPFDGVIISKEIESGDGYIQEKQ